MIPKLTQDAFGLFVSILRGLAQAEKVPSLLARRHVEMLRKREVARGPARLAGYGFKAFSQNDEDGILQEIFRRIGTTAKCFVEFGCGDGLENNTAYLLLSGWSGLWLDACPKRVKAVQRLYKYALEGQRLKIEQKMLTQENVNETLEHLCGTTEIDLLSIDIDGNDYWLWQALTRLAPRVVIIEYNATLRPPVSLVQPYRADAAYNGTNYFGSSLKALEKLGQSKGYSLVGCDLAGINSFFVRNDCLRDQFAAAFTAENYYMPPNYDLFTRYIASAHPAGAGEYVSV